ncbi:hypothetical protein [Dactylosporangium salmoneum]|uniref:MFS transporter n=1 Tax=Dactylosporangium salmoneum TaxID=53361 RepID=A0ABN3I1F7_9ACTN
MVVALAVAALRVRVPAARPANPPRPGAVALAAGLATLGFMGLIWPFGGARQPMFTHGAWAFAPMAGAAVVAALAVIALRRWAAHPAADSSRNTMTQAAPSSRPAAWTPRHRLAACIGALVSHSLFGLAANADNAVDRAFLLGVAALTVVLGLLVAGRLDRAA